MNIALLENSELIYSNKQALDRLKSIGNVIIEDNVSEERLYEIMDSTELLIINKTVVDKKLIDYSKKLKYIGIMSTGFNTVDYEYAKSKGIVVTNCPAYSSQSVSLWAMGFIINLATSMPQYINSVARGEWKQSKTFCYTPYPTREISEKTLGLIGFGGIAKEVAKQALGFGMKVIANTLENVEMEGVTFASKEEVFAKADFVSIHCPLNEHTKYLVNKYTLKLMKKTAYLINTSRGMVVNEDDLAYYLNNDLIAGAGLDVLIEEPMVEDCVLFNAKNCFITPHVAWSTDEAQIKLINLAVNNLKAFLDGSEVNVVNK